ncbi:MAG: hypothetical protein AAFZ91_11455 [Pseudomonadota bacterium]
MLRLVRTLFLLLVTGLTIAPNHADIVDRVRFAQAPVLMVWTGDGDPQIGSRVEVQPNIVAAAPIAFPGTGRLEPIQAVSRTSTQKQTFRVASNTGFKISAVAHASLETSKAPVTVEIRYPGANADSTLTRLIANQTSLSTLSRPTQLLSLARKTAKQAGTPLSQSIEIEIDWGALPNGEVTLTLEAISE